ncbi:MAG: hypothetical protein R3B57_12115 [Phycisphaerales bacterium]
MKSALRTVMSGVSVVAILNLAGVAGLAAWLATSGRLDVQRLRDVRELFAETVAERDARLAEEAAAAAPVDAPEPEVRPVTFEQSLELVGAGAEMIEQERRKLEKEGEQLRASLARDRGMLETERTAFETRKQNFEAMLARLRAIEGDEQFKKSLSLLEGVKADQAKAAVMELLAQGKREEVVSYLDAMDERKRTKLFAQFISDGEETLAAELLEDLRTRGVEPPGS